MPKTRSYKRAKPIRRINLLGMVSTIESERQKFNKKYPSLSNTTIADAYAKSMVGRSQSHSEKSRHLVVRVLGRMLYDKRVTPEEISLIFREIEKISGRAAGLHLFGNAKHFKRRNP
ncbi:MAG: hypothetical protein Q7S21_04495 [archaeon]|nr:hypothetical protein [archaeon]